MSSLPVALRIALRELRAGIRGFRIFIACLALGVAAIAAVGALSASVVESLERDGQAILGGDAEFRLLHREAADGQVEAMQAAGQISFSRQMRGMVRLENVPDQGTLVEVKAVDNAYPLYGAITLNQNISLTDALAPRDGIYGALVDPNLLTRLTAEVGDKVRLGDALLEIRGTIAREPDRVTSVFTLGPRLMIHGDALETTGLIQPGSLVRNYYRVRLNDGVDRGLWLDGMRDDFTDAGWRIRTTEDAAPRVTRFVDRLGLFLTLVGLTILLVGGIGVSNAVRSHLESRIGSIAVLKCVGATSSVIFRAYLIQVMLIALLGTAIGLLLGAFSPLLFARALEAALPTDIPFGFHLLPMVQATAFGLLTALVFALWPLGRVGVIPGAALFRNLVAPTAGRPRGGVLITLAIAATALVALAVLGASRPGFAIAFVIGSVAAMMAFRYCALGVMKLAARVNPGRDAGLRLALANMHRPGAATPAVIMSLGLGLAVLVAIGQIEGNLRQQVDQELPNEAPAFFFIDIQRDQIDGFEAAVRKVEGAGEIERTATLRGMIVGVNGRPASEIAADPDQAWVLQGDRSITYAARPAPDANIVAGEWWDADYRGEPLVSFEADAAKGIGLNVGDQITVNILGRKITAKVANLRDVDWGTLRLNFVMVFSPGVLDGAPYTYIATAKATPAAEDGIERAVISEYPNISAIRIRDALDLVKVMLGNIALAVRSTAGLTLLAGALVLAGAVAAGHRRRIYDAVVLKVLGATRGDILRAFLIEYGLLGLAAGLIAIGVGSLTGWAVMTQVMNTGFTFQPLLALLTALLCIAVTLAFGFGGAWNALGKKAAPLLRNE
ncbi:MAG: FtsX-like permease family protein [Rhodospirillales bacterium]